ncbi:MAG: hypothetical protein QMD80_02455 [archaeon]|nr:hypothetical protein [archaeon]
MDKRLYYLPGYYDLAFSYDVSGEIKFFAECFKRYADFDVRRILEPACGSITIQTTWHTERYDTAQKRKHNICKMRIEDEKTSTRFMFIEPHIMRLWFFDDFKRLSREGGFVLKAIYNQNFELVPLESHICGELGNLYFILKKESEA